MRAGLWPLVRRDIGVGAEMEGEKGASATNWRPRAALDAEKRFRCPRLNSFAEIAGGTGALLSVALGAEIDGTRGTEGGAELEMGELVVFIAALDVFNFFA